MIAPRQIGWSEKANLLWEISKQLDRAIAVTCTGPCPTPPPLCNYLYEGTLTVGESGNNIGYSSNEIGGFGSISPLNSNIIALIWNTIKDKIELNLTLEECYVSIDVYINGTLYTLANVGNFYQLNSPNPFPAVGETCIIQICPGNLC